MKLKNTVQGAVKHDGDCSCYRLNCEICDCGALRELVSGDKLSGNDIRWVAWANHLEAIDRSCQPI